MIALGQRPARRRPSLTPMIDVVFLLLVFFMLVARTGRDGAFEVGAVGGTGPYDGPPRLVTVAPEGLFLNGRPLDAADLPEALAPLVSGPEDVIVLRGRDGATLGDLTRVADRLRRAGHDALVLAE